MKLPSALDFSVVQGDVMNAVDVEGAIPAHELVIVSLGNSQNPFALVFGARRTTSATVCETGTRHIVAAMESPQLPLAFKLFYRTLLREQMADKEKQEELIKSSSLNWTLVQPVGLTDKPATHNWLADTQGVIRRREMSRADVAEFLVSLVGSEHYSRSTVALSG